MREDSRNRGRVWADFNDLFQGDRILCLSHSDVSRTENGGQIRLEKGMQLTAFMEDLDEQGNRDDLVASGIVASSPDWLRKHGSKWILIIDENGVKHESDLRSDLDTEG